MGFKMKGMNYGQGTGSAFYKTDDKKTSKIDESIAAMEKAYTGKTSGKDYERDIKLFSNAYGDDASKSLISKLNQSGLQDYEKKQGEYSADKPYEAGDIGKNRQVGLFNPVTPRFDFSKIDYGRGGKPRTEYKRHTTDELKKIIKDKPHRFGGFDPVKDADRMDEILRPGKIAYADKFGKWKGGKQVRYEYGDKVRFHGIDQKRKDKILSDQKSRIEADAKRKSKFTSRSSSDLKTPKIHPMDMKVKPTTGKFAPKSGLKFGRKYKK
tara:strand:+ start:382 stop:1182 length:801 start_codon:yes stop_codon:yes gene_type:complete